MQATLTGIGIAIILALAAAFAAPLFIDWSAYRDLFEARVARIAGVPVKVLGDVDVRLLPSPYVRFGDVVVGEEGGARLEVDGFEMRLALAPLLRGEVRVAESTLDGARLQAALGEGGELRLPFDREKAALPEAERVILDHLEIRNLHAEVLDQRSGSRIALAAPALDIEAGSLAGPFKVEGTAEYGGASYRVRFATAAFDDHAIARGKLLLDRIDEPRRIDADGLMIGTDGRPRFDGTITVSRPLIEGAKVPGEPWRVTGKVKLDPSRALVDGLDLQYGPDDRALKLTGTFDLRLGQDPTGILVLNARQLDLDRVLGRDAASTEPMRPLDALAAFASRFPAVLAPPLPIRVTGSVDGIVLAGDLLQGVEVEAAFNEFGWRVDRLAARLPGGAAASTVGDLSVAGPGDAPRATYRGALSVNVPDTSVLMHWLEGGGTAARPDTPVRRIALEGTVDLGPDAAAIEKATLDVDGARLTGSLAWRATGGRGGIPLFSASVSAKELDLDKLPVGRLFALSGSGIGAAGGHDVRLKLDADSLVLAGVRASKIAVDIAAAPGLLDVHRLGVADLGGARVDAEGRLALTDGRVEGRLTAQVEAARLDGMVRVLRALPVPAAAVDAFAARAALLAPAAVTVVVGSDGSTSGGFSAQVDGTLAGSMVAARARMARLDVQSRLDASLSASAADGRVLLAQIGLPVSPLAAAAPATVSATMEGVPAEGAPVSVKVGAFGATATLDGTAKLDAAGAVGLDATLAGETADLGPLLVAGARAAPGLLPTLPAKATAHATLAEGTLTLDGLDMVVAGRPVTGALILAGGRLGGRLAVDRLTLVDLIGMLTGPGAVASVDGRGWPNGTFGPGLLDGLDSEVTIAPNELVLEPGLSASAASFVLRSSGSEFAVADIGGDLASGRLSGGLKLKRSGSEIALAGQVGIENAAVAELLAKGGAAPALSGHVSLKAEIEGAGRSPAGLLAGLTGRGILAMRDARARGVDAGAFDRVDAAIDDLAKRPAGLKETEITPEGIAAMVEGELVKGDLAIDEVTGTFSIASGTLRATNLAVSAARARVTASGSYDLLQGLLTGEVRLAPKGEGDAVNLEREVTLNFAGPVAAVRRELDVRSLTGYLTSRVLEERMRQREAEEAAERAREAARKEEDARRQAEEARRAEEERRKAEEERQRQEEERRRSTDRPLPGPNDRTDAGGSGAETKAAASDAAGLPGAADAAAPAGTTAGATANGTEAGAAGGTGATGGTVAPLDPVIVIDPSPGAAGTTTPAAATPIIIVPEPKAATASPDRATEGTGARRSTGAAASTQPRAGAAATGGTTERRPERRGGGGLLDFLR